MAIDSLKAPAKLVIELGPQDLEWVMMLHNDALVTYATVANDDVTQVSIDSGSLVNVLFLGTGKDGVGCGRLAAYSYTLVWVLRAHESTTRPDPAAPLI